MGFDGGVLLGEGLVDQPDHDGEVAPFVVAGEGGSELSLVWLSHCGHSRRQQDRVLVLLGRHSDGVEA